MTAISLLISAVSASSFALGFLTSPNNMEPFLQEQWIKSLMGIVVIISLLGLIVAMPSLAKALG